LSYARRQSLVQILGLTTCDPDQDGGPESYETISDKQVADIAALIDEVGADKAKFFRWAKVTKLSEILVCNYDHSVSELRRKGRQK
jgi:hypothetical protein